MRKNPILGCQGYRINREMDLVRIQADFVLRISPKHREEIAEALKRIELYMSGNISLVNEPDKDKTRCFYCGTANDQRETNCVNCGAVL